jgi:uncharacterized membrane protein
VDLTGLVELAQNSALSEWLRTSLKAVAIVNAAHVISIATVFGTIFFVDLRLLGYPDVQRSFTRLHHALVRWTWGAFALAVVSGVLLFMVNAVTYQRNTAFWLKMGVIGLAGLNMLAFERFTAKSVASWDQGVLPPPAARLAGALSIALWVTVIFLGRWIGFTKGYDFSIPEDVHLDFSFE